MNIIGRISEHVKIFLTGLSLLAMGIGIAGIWGYAGPESVGKALGTMALVGVTVFVIDGLIYGKRETVEAKPDASVTNVTPPK